MEQSSDDGARKPNWWLWAVAIGVIVWLAYEFGGGSTGSAQPGTTGGRASAPVAASSACKDVPECALASIDAGRLLSTDDTRVSSYARQLDRVQAKCRGSRTNIGDYVVYAQKRIKAADQAITLSQLLDGMDHAIPPGAEGTLGCDEVVAAVLTIMKV